MKVGTRLLAPLFSLALLAACGGDELGAGGLTAEEERALDNAAAMLDDNAIDTSPDSLTANAAELDGAEAGAEEAPADNAQ